MCSFRLADFRRTITFPGWIQSIGYAAKINMLQIYRDNASSNRKGQTLWRSGWWVGGGPLVLHVEVLVSTAAERGGSRPAAAAAAACSQAM